MSYAERPIILAVDDKPEILTAIVNMLSSEFLVMGMTSAEAAMRIVEKYTPVLFILDIEMPGTDGYELAWRLRAIKRYERTPIIFLTAKGTRDNVVTAIAGGGNDFIVKPVTKEILLERIHKHLSA